MNSSRDSWPCNKGHAPGPVVNGWVICSRCKKQLYAAPKPKGGKR